MSSEHDELLTSPTEVTGNSGSGAPLTEITTTTIATTTLAGATALRLPPPSESQQQQEPHNFTEKELGEYKETDRYLPVRCIIRHLMMMSLFLVVLNIVPHSFRFRANPIQYPF